MPSETGVSFTQQPDIAMNESCAPDDERTVILRRSIRSNEGETPPIYGYQHG